MRKNIGKADRIVRLLVAAGVILLYVTNIIHAPLAYALLVIAGVFVFSSLTGFCPLYQFWGMNTLGQQEKE